MNRRSVLAGAGVLGALGTGIVGYELFRRTPPTPDPVTDAEFETSYVIGSDPRIEEGPLIDISRTESMIEVSGAFTVGNECYEARIDNIEHNADTDELIVSFVGQQKPFWERGTGCDDADIANEYWLSVVVDPMPDVVTARELDPWNEYSTRVETDS